MNTTITRRAALALFTGLALAACGGEDPPLVASSTQQQSAPASSLAIGVGELKASKTIVSVSDTAGPRLSRVTITASASNVRAIGAGATASLRYVIRAGGSVVTQGTLVSASAAGGVGGNARYELDLAGGALIEAEIVATVESAGAAGIAWDAATLSSSIAIK